MQSVSVKHNVEMAHRLQLPGKCQNIHGHTWQVTFEIHDDPNRETGIIVDFHQMKRVFREYLDNKYDHKLCMWIGDPWLGQLRDASKRPDGIELYPPGLLVMDEDPTTENFARWIGRDMRLLTWEWPHGPNRLLRITVEEGLHNGASWEG